MPSTNHFAYNQTDLSCLQPLDDNVLVRRIEHGETAGGIYIPQSEDSSFAARGLVLKIGPGRMENGVRIPSALKEGDIVFLASNPIYPPIDFHWGSETLHIVKERSLALRQIVSHASPDESPENNVEQ